MHRFTQLGSLNEKPSSNPLPHSSINSITSRQSVVHQCTFYTATTPKVYFDRTAPLPTPLLFHNLLGCLDSLFTVLHKTQATLLILFYPLYSLYSARFPPFLASFCLWLPELLLPSYSTIYRPGPRQLLTIPFHLIPVLPLPLVSHLPTTSTSPLPPPPLPPSRLHLPIHVVDLEFTRQSYLSRGLCRCERVVTS